MPTSPQHWTRTAPHPSSRTCCGKCSRNSAPGRTPARPATWSAYWAGHHATSPSSQPRPPLTARGPPRPRGPDPGWESRPRACRSARHDRCRASPFAVAGWATARPVWSYAMRTAALVLMWIVRVAGVVQILLGLSIWIGVSGQFYSLHIPNGILIVGGLWGLAVLVLLARGRPGLVAFAFLWGLALPVFGLWQGEM